MNWDIIEMNYIHHIRLSFDALYKTMGTNEY